jgi:hypothetical protein
MECLGQLWMAQIGVKLRDPEFQVFSPDCASADPHKTKLCSLCSCPYMSLQRPTCPSPYFLSHSCRMHLLHMLVDGIPQGFPSCTLCPPAENL